MSENRIPKKFKTSWGAEYIVDIKADSSQTEKVEKQTKNKEIAKTSTSKISNLLLVIVVIIFMSLFFNKLIIF